VIQHLRAAQWPLVACLGWALTFGIAGNARAGSEEGPSFAKKVQPYIGCLNRLTERAIQSRSRYLSWADKSGPTGREKIVYGLYTLYDPADCNRGISGANEIEPHDAALEEAGAAFMSSLMALTPLVKEAADYYEQGDYKDDKMAKGRQLHPRLMAAWDSFLAANGRLRDAVERINEQVQLEALAQIERTEGRKTRYFALALMIKAKALVRAEGDGDAGAKALVRAEGDGDAGAFDIARVTQALEGYEAAIKDIEAHGASNPEEKAGPIFVSAARSFLKTGKELMRRVRDKTPYSAGERMNLSNSLSGWMVEGSPPALIHNYNQLVERFNAGPGI
jgi:hypothetical protein